MYKIAKSKERRDLFINTAAKMGLDAALVEKDFWVCLVLDYLFNSSKWRDSLIFKGGTSLSKVYKVIERFSEDIDLILDWTVLNYSKDEPWENRTSTKQQKFIDDCDTRMFKFLTNDFLPTFKKDMETLLNQQLNIIISRDDGLTVNFRYPNLFENNDILKEIRLEIGALAAWTPAQKRIIKPYVAEYYPNIFLKKEINILTTTAERTFWEKATILHQEAFRPETSHIPTRYSRHYYDLYSMTLTPTKNNALKQSNLLEKVAEFKNKFYPRKWARYDLAKISTLKLYPADHSIKELKEDYKKMKTIIYGKYPDFDVILKTIKNLEIEINNLKKS